MGEHHEPERLNVTWDHEHLSCQPPVLTFGCSGRFSDNLGPYITTRDTDDGPHYHPGGQRYESVGLALPDVRAHVIGAVLRFRNPEHVRQLIVRLQEVEAWLEEKFTPADFVDVDPGPVDVDAA